MSTAEQIASADRVVLTPHDRSGATRRSAPARVVLTTDGRLGIWPAPTTCQRVRVEPCDRRGRTSGTTSPVAGTAEVVRSGALLDEVRGRVREKYGWRARLATRRAGAVMLVSLDEPTG